MYAKKIHRSLPSTEKRCMQKKIGSFCLPHGVYMMKVASSRNFDVSGEYRRALPRRFLFFSVINVANLATL